jgi:hypothetical protein
MDTYKAWLRDVGVTLPERRLDRLASRIARELEVRTGSEIIDHLSDEQLDEFDAILEEANQKQLVWLLKHYPDYPKVVEREEKRLRKELKQAKSPVLLIKHWHRVKPE